MPRCGAGAGEPPEFGEAIAILAAFGLLNLAYGALARAYDPALAARMSALLADAVGPRG